MTKYELTIVLDGKATSAQKKAKVSFLESLIKINDGKITKSDDWGVKDLSYKIAKSLTGAFLYFELTLDPSKVKEVSEKVKLEDGILRYLLVKQDGERIK